MLSDLIDKLLIGVFTILFMFAVVIAFVPVIMFDYVLPFEKEAIKGYKCHH